MGEVYNYNNGTHLTTVKNGAVSLTQAAYLGNVGLSSLTIEDEAGTISIVGMKDFAVTQSSCSQTHTFTGFADVRRYERTNAPQVAASRNIELSLRDLNAMLGFRGIRGVTTEVSRPAESVAARGAWLLAQAAVSGLFVDNGRCDFSSTRMMTKTNYRNRYPGDVLADMALAQGGVNYHVQDYGAGPELIFRDDNASTADSSSLRISNVLSDASSVTLNPSKDAVLTRDPGRVKSQIALEWAQGNVYESRAATATAFNGIRFGVATNSDIKTAAKATEEATDMLWQLHTEEDFIECWIQLTDVQVNLVMAGYRIQAKFSHLNTEGYGSFTWFRVLERTVKPLVAEGTLYEVHLKLSPQEAADIPGDCVDLYPGTPSGTFYPLGGSMITSESNPSDGVVYYFRPGDGVATVPTVGATGHWHFPLYGAGGLGTIDYFGDCASNVLQFIVVGDGTMAIQTEIYAGGPRAISIIVLKSDGTEISTQAATSGDAVEVVIDDTTDGDCIRLVKVQDASYPTCGGKIGWSQMTWVAV